MDIKHELRLEELRKQTQNEKEESKIAHNTICSTTAKDSRREDDSEKEDCKKGKSACHFKFHSKYYPRNLPISDNPNETFKSQPCGYAGK